MATKKAASKRTTKKKRVAKKKTKKTKQTKATTTATRKKAVPRKKARVRRRKRPVVVRWALALSSDFKQAAFCAGALHHLGLAKGKREFPLVAGAGSGAILAALAALGSFETMADAFCGLDGRQVARRRYGWLPGGPAARAMLAGVNRAPSLYLPADELREMLARLVDPVALAQSRTEVHFSSLDLQSGVLRSFCNHVDPPDELLAGLLAAASPPVLFPPVRAGYAHHQHVEGGFAGEGPLRAVFRALGRENPPAVDRILLLSTKAARSASATPSARGLGEVARRVWALAGQEQGWSEICAAQLVNGLLGLRDGLGAERFQEALAALDPATRSQMERHLKKRRTPLVHLHPAQAASGAPLEFDAVASRAAFEAGQQAARRMLG